MIRLWYGSGLQHSILGIVAATDTIQIDGDYTDRYIAGTSLVITNNANNGTYTVESVSLSGGDTYIVTEEDLTSDTGAAGEITVQNRVDFDWSRFFPKGSRPQIAVEDRLNIVHRIGPSDSTELQSFPTRGVLRVLYTEIVNLSMDDTAFPDILRANSILLDTEFELFHSRDNYPDGTNQWTSLLAYKVKFDDPWATQGSLDSIGDDMPQFIEFPVTITSDGTFTDIDVRTSTTYRTRPT